MHIDVHAHFMPRDCMDVIDDAGRRYDVVKNFQNDIIENAQEQSTGSLVYKLCDPEKRIKDMDATGVDMQVLSPVPQSAYYNLEAEACLWYSRRQNDGIAQAVRRYPDRFSGMATVPLQAPDMAIAELDRAINELGLRGVQILSNVNGRDLDSPELLRFLQAVEALDVPIFIHPGQVTGTERMKEYHLRNLVGYPLETTLAAAHIIFGGVLEKCPNLKVCLAHGGGYLPYQRGRWEHGYDVRAEARTVIKEPPSHYLCRFYCDTIVHCGPPLEFLVESLGGDRILMATDYPFDMGDPTPVSTVMGLKNVSEEDRERILGGNAERLLRLECEGRKIWRAKESDGGHLWRGQNGSMF